MNLLAIEGFCLWLKIFKGVVQSAHDSFVVVVACTATIKSITVSFRDRHGGYKHEKGQ